ncbi:hypoxanthine phosphoribosyltransferase [Geminicoccaceae bacterium 1502E]|uniref:Hypoxanthine phosphoribosyltransferase n=1 Tax=Marinimicrococcus flavescens TaxID=3031815 RepID=A0AAP3XQV4_9PROT|nr:hypoxanthine phosphoribosyltransferase [Marinimicrococcus flavescens]MDX6751807.1 hypoxanthine phosphoribosyltransferase [Geminicoccaceae bacterium 1502E]
MSGLARCVIDAGLASREAVFARLAEQLDCPLPANLDALYDILSREAAGPLEIVWRADRRALGEDFERILAALQEVALERDDMRLLDEAAERDEMDEQVKVLFSEQEVAARVQELAREIAARMPREFTLVGLLKGAFVFTADLVRALDREGCRPRVEFLQVSSYGTGTESSGRVKVIGGMPGSIEGQEVLLVDDIQDTGRTLAFTRQMLLDNGAARAMTCALLDKPSRRVVEIEPDLTGFVIDDVFVVGYGIDYAERYRHLPFIGKVEAS